MNRTDLEAVAAAAWQAASTEVRSSLLAQVSDPSFKIPRDIPPNEHIGFLTDEFTEPAYEEAAKSIRAALGDGLANEYESEWVAILEDLCVIAGITIIDEAVESVPWLVDRSGGACESLPR